MCLYYHVNIVIAMHTYYIEGGKIQFICVDWKCEWQIFISNK